MKQKSDNWKKRRRLLYLSLLFIGCLTIYSFLYPTPERVSIVNTLLGTGGILLVSYIFGATYEDIKKSR